MPWGGVVLLVVTQDLLCLRAHRPSSDTITSDARDETGGLHSRYPVQFSRTIADIQLGGRETPYLTE